MLSDLLCDWSLNETFDLVYLLFLFFSFRCVLTVWVFGTNGFRLREVVVGEVTVGGAIGI